MRSVLLPLGLAALCFNPSFAQQYATSGGADPASALRITANLTTEPAAPLTLQSALDLALAASPTLSAAAREVEAIEAGIVQAGARRNPEVSLFADDTQRSTRETTLLFSQPIELGGKRGARIEAAERGRDSALAELAATRAEIRGNTIAAYFEVLASQERLQLAQSSVDLAGRAREAAAKRVTAGKVSPIEETKARVAESAARIEFNQAKSELAIARNRLSAVWGNPVARFERAEGAVDELPPLISSDDLNTRLQIAPALVRARREVERRRALTEVERRRRVPDITLSLGARRNEDLGRSSAVFGVAIPIPVFDRNQGNVLEAVRRTDKARDELSATEIRLASDLSAVQGRLDAARQEIQTLRDEILPGSQSAFDAATKGYQLGKFSFLEVLDAQRTLFQARSQYLRALAGAQRSVAEIEGLLGQASLLAPTVGSP